MMFADVLEAAFAAEIATDPDSGLDMVWGRGAVLIRLKAVLRTSNTSPLVSAKR